MLARGHKSGGFNDNASQVADGVPYRPGEVNSYELGFKTESADRRWALDGALFLNRVKDDHLLAFNPDQNFSTVAVNVDTRSRGAELQGAWRPIKGLSLSGGVSFIDGAITSDALGVSGGDVHSGNRLPDVPRWSAVASVQYSAPVAAFAGMTAPQWTTRLSWRHVGARANDAQNNFDLKAYDKVDLRMGISSGNTEFYVWGDNLLNKRYDRYGYQYTPALRVGAPTRGRSFGLGLAHYF